MFLLQVGLFYAWVWRWEFKYLRRLVCFPTHKHMKSETTSLFVGEYIINGKQFGIDVT